MEKIKGILNGVEKEYDVMLTFHSNKFNKDYIVYTDNSVDEEGKLKVYAAIYDKNAEEPFVGYPASQEEWNEIAYTINHAYTDK